MLWERVTNTSIWSSLRHGSVRSVFFLCFTLIALPALASPIQVSHLLSALHWRSVGPYIGGRVVAVDGVSSNADMFYMGAADGGVWKSTNYGVSWKNISDGWPSTSDSIGAIAVAPSNPKIIYVGTGENDIRGDMVTGDGIFKSENGGRTWKYDGLRDTHTTTSLIVDPNNSNIVYAASMGHVFVSGPDRGVFKSTNGGKSWHKVLFVNDKTGIIDLVMDPKNPNVLYAAAWQAYRRPWKLSSGGPGSGIYKTTDGGRHWTNISDHQGLPSGILGRIGLAVAPSNPSVLYASVQAHGGGLFRSRNGGRTWKRVNRSWKLRQRAFYYSTVFVDPKNPNTIYMPQVDALYVSHDGGKRFSQLNTPHGDNHVLWINPNYPNVLLEGNDGGATVSTDSGRTWSTEDNQPTGQFYHVNLDHRFPFHIYGAQQDEGSFEGPSATANGNIPLRAWHTVAYGESTFVVPQPGNPNITYGSGYYSLFFKYNAKTEQFQSVSPWPSYHDGAPSSRLRYRFAWTHPILFSPVKPSELLIGSQYVMESLDYGRQWKTISPDLTRNVAATEGPTGGSINLDQSGAEVYPNVSALAVSPLDNNVIWAGSSDGLVHITVDGGQQWHLVTPPDLPKWTRISSIQPSHFSPGTAYLAARRYMWDDFRPYVFKTTDYGRHWTRITNGLPNNEYVFAICQDPTVPGLLFLGTKNTVYVSFDGGRYWQSLALNLPHVQVRSLAINRREGELVAATHGRAFWVLDNLKYLEELAKENRLPANHAALFAPQTAWLTHAYGNVGETGSLVQAGRNPTFGATVFFYIPHSYRAGTPVSLSIYSVGGKLIRKFKLHAKHKLKAPGRNLTSYQKQQRAVVQATGIKVGANVFRWNLRYPDAVEASGFYAPAAAGGLTDSVRGPTVTPGDYKVVLDYAGKKIRRRFRVELDPRIHTSEVALHARLGLQMQIHQDLTKLDRTVNSALLVIHQLQARGHYMSQQPAAHLIHLLRQSVDRVVQFKVDSSEGDLMHQMRLHSHLAFLQADIGMAYSRPTPAQYRVFRELDARVSSSDRQLRRLVRRARKLL